jgi:hypothetical protein
MEEVMANLAGHMSGQRPRRGRHITMEELIQETEFKVAYQKGYESYLCPCRSCHSRHMYTSQTIRIHLRLNECNKMLNFSMVGRDPPWRVSKGGHIC